MKLLKRRGNKRKTLNDPQSVRQGLLNVLEHRHQTLGGVRGDAVIRKAIQQN